LSTAQDSRTSAKNQALYRATVQEAASGGAELMGKMVAAARLVLQTREAASRDLRERDMLAESAKLLRRHEPALCKKYPEVLLETFANPDGPKKAAPASVESLNFDQLELMDETQVLTSVALARTQQLAVQATEAMLSDLNTLVCALLGLGAVRAESNPLRPEMYVKALKETLEQTNAPSAMQLDWVAAMGPTLSRELQTLYKNLCTKLRGDGVVSVAFAVSQTPNAVGVGRGVAQLPSGSSQGRLGDDQNFGTDIRRPDDRNDAGARTSGGMGRDEALLTLDKLRRLLSGELDSGMAASRVDQFAAQFAHQFESGPQAAVVESEFDVTVPAALEALTEMRQVDRVVQSLEQRRSGGASSAAAGSVDHVRTQLRKDVRDIAQALSLEVVTLMVENMARDPRLLAPIQDLIRGLEPPLLRLALVDPRFFTNKQHVARTLLQEVTHRSMAFGSVHAVGFPAFLQGLRDHLGPLADAAVDSAEPFERSLKVLQGRWQKEGRDRELDRQAAVEVLQHAEARNLLAEKIARGIEAHPDSKRVAPVVIDFLCGPWAQVVAQARIKGGAGSATADKFQALIPALLWSAHPELARQSVSKLTRLVPKLLATMRDGLETIRYPATRTSAFFEALMAVHQVAFKATEDTPVPADPLPGAGRHDLVEEGDPWIAPQEAESSNFIELDDIDIPVPIAHAALSAVPGAEPKATEPDPAPATSSAREPAGAAPLVQAAGAEQVVVVPGLVPAEATIDGDLPLGIWVELLTGDQWVRTQLTWASPHATLFLFTSAHGTTQSMTRRSRDRLVQAGRLRMISTQAVMDVALNAVAQEAMRNSVHGTP
jgi:hypothetical protein